MSGDAALQGLGVLCTRPADRSASLRAVLSAQGARPLSIPALQIAPLPIDASMQAIAQRLDEFAAVIWVSPAAAEQGCELLQEWWPQWPVGVQWIAVGAATAAALEAAGLDALNPAEFGLAENSEGILELPVLKDCVGRRVLLVRGASGRDHLHRKLLERAAKVEELVLYRRDRPVQGDAQLQQALDAGEVDATLAYSGETLQNLADMAGRLKNRLDLLPLFVPGARVAAIARRLGFRDVTSVPGTGDDVMLEALLDRFGARQPRDPHGSIQSSRRRT